MLKKDNFKVSKGILALMLAGTLLATGFLIVAPRLAFADFQRVIPATDASGHPLTGSSSIFYTAHRIPDPIWAPCFATSCSAGTGPGAGMYFDLYDSSGNIIAQGWSDETGVTITGLTAGATYYIHPLDCDNCHQDPNLHNVVFYYWYDGSMTNPRGFVAGSGSPQTEAFYRYINLMPGTTNPPVPPAPGQSGGTPPGNPPPNNPPPNNPPPTNPPPHVTHPVLQSRHVMRLDASDLNTIVDLKKVVVATMDINQTGTASISNVTTISDTMVPDASLSGVPLGPTHHVTVYKSLYDVANVEPIALQKAESMADSVGLDWNKLSDMQKAYLALTLEYNQPSGASLIPDTNLSGVPLGAAHVKIQYKSLYDVANGDPMGLEKAEVAANDLNIDWNSLSDMQKAYMALVLDNGKPST
jgi:hypothetical protein